MMLPTLQIGPLAMQVPGLVVLLGLWIGLTLSEKHSSRFGLSADNIYNLSFAVLIAAAIGGRLVYIARYPSAFIVSPISMISLNPGLFDLGGAIAAALIVALIYGQRKKIKFWSTLDALTPLFAVIAVSLGLSHLASGASFGAQSDLPWSIELWGVRRHPSQIYEIIASLIILVILWPGRQKPLYSGRYFLIFITMTAAARLFLEAFRGDSILVVGNFRLAQLIFWGILAIAMFSLQVMRYKQDRDESKMFNERIK